MKELARTCLKKIFYDRAERGILIGYKFFDELVVIIDPDYCSLDGYAVFLAQFLIRIVIHFENSNSFWYAPFFMSASRARHWGHHEAWKNRAYQKELLFSKWITIRIKNCAKIRRNHPDYSSPGR